MSGLSRRDFLAAAASVPLAVSNKTYAASQAQIVVIGGGFGGASIARYLRRHELNLPITLVEREEHFVTCPFSNGVLGGLWPLSRP
jgi:sulfide dehydrogenase [flavocytochrome c] flavoprotein chain